MTHTILGRAAAAVAFAAVLAGPARAQRPSTGAPRLVLGEGRALIVSPPVTTVKVQPTIRVIPKTQAKAGPRPVTSFRPALWPDKAAMFKKVGIAVMVEDSSTMFSLAGDETIAPAGQGALWSSPEQSLRPDGAVEPGGEITVGVQGRFARAHPSLQLHFYVQNDSPYAWSMHNLLDGSEIDVPLKPKAPVDIVVLVTVPANLVADDKLDVVYGLVTLGLSKNVHWEFHRVDVLPISSR